MTLKKLYLPMFLGLLLFSFGCVSSSDSDGENEPNEDGIVTLTFMGWEASPLETESVEKGIEKFESENPNIKINYTPVPGDQYPSKLLTMMAGDSPPDVFFLGSNEYRAFQKRDVLLDLTSYFDNSLDRSDFIPSSAEIMEIDENIYGISSSTVSPVLYYNKDLFDEVGQEYPPSNPDEAWSWEEFVDVAEKMTADNTDQYGVYGLEALGNFIPAVYSNGGRMFNDEMTEIAMNSNETKQVLETILEMKKTGISPEVKLLEESGMSETQMLQTKKIAMLVTGSWALQELATMDFPVGVAALPTFDKSLTTGQAHVHSASATTKYPEEAWEFIKFLSSEEYQLDLVKSGLWMPNRSALYEEDGIEKWLNEDVHPEEFRELIPYFYDAEIEPFAVIGNNEVRDILEEEMDRFWYDNESIDTVIESIENRSNELLSE